MFFSLVRVSEQELENYLSDSSLFDDKLNVILNDENDDAWIDIGKSWGGILFLLTGGGLDRYEHPMAKVLFSGQKIVGKENSHYESADYLRPAEVRELYTEISIPGNEELIRFDSVKMNDENIYPGGIWDESRFKNVLQSFGVLKEVYLKAVERNEAIITFIS